MGIISRCLNSSANRTFTQQRNTGPEQGFSEQEILNFCLHQTTCFFSLQCKQLEIHYVVPTNSSLNSLLKSGGDCQHDGQKGNSLMRELFLLFTKHSTEMSNLTSHRNDHSKQNKMKKKKKPRPTQFVLMLLIIWFFLLLEKLEGVRFFWLLNHNWLSHHVIQGKLLRLHAF